jgi:hypothetical protein
LRDNLLLSKIEAALLWAAFVLLHGSLPAEVFNTFVENAVQNALSIGVSDLASAASAFCTGVSAGTFVVELVSIHR